MNNTFAALKRKLVQYLSLLCLSVAGSIQAGANIYNVTQTSDGHATTQLRGALEAADALGGTHTINLPAGTYNLTLGTIAFGNNAQNITIIGAGSSSTIINMTSTAQDRIFLINPPGTIPNVSCSISGIKFTGGNLTSDPYGGGAIVGGGPGNVITITNCAFENNSVALAGSQGGGALNFQGGGSVSIDQCSFTNNTTSESLGGAIYFYLINQAGLSSSLGITNCTFTGNSATWSFEPSGGAIAIITEGQASGQNFSATIQKNTFSNNSITTGSQPNGGGGAIYIHSAYATHINYNRFYNNYKSGNRNALLVSKAQPGVTNASNNWWGCNDDPAAATACADRALLSAEAGSGTLITAPRLQLKASAAAGTICQGSGATVVSAGFTNNSSNQVIAAANLTRLAGLPVSFNATNGSLSGIQTTVQASGTATVSFNGNAATGTGTINAIVDNTAAGDLTARASVSVSTAPVISGHPSGMQGCPGTVASFTVAVSNVIPTYQWYKGSTPLSNGATGTGSTLSGVTTGTLSITNPGAADAVSNYNCVVSNSCGSAVSNNAGLTLYGSRLYVSPTGSGNGSSWANAMGNLNTALTVASACSNITEIWVKAGTYIPAAKPYGASTPLARDNAFFLINDLAVYGGFAGMETNLSERNVTANPTILSGDMGVPDDASDNCVHVVVSLNNNASALLDGFTITGGNANYTTTPNATISSVLINRTFGGGISMNNSSARIQHCTFRSCNAANGGGAIFQGAGSVKITGCTFTANTAHYGGAIRNEGTPALAVSDCIFVSNTAHQSAGAMSLYQGTDTLTNNLFIKNKDLSVTQGGGAVCVSSGSFYLVNNTFYADTTMGLGGALRSESGSGTLKVHNNIFYKCYGALGNNDVNNVTTSYTESNNSFSTTNPLFFNEEDPDGADNIFGTADDGFVPVTGSPLLDAGSNSAVPANLSTDIKGAARIQAGTVDIGAFEGGVTAPLPLKLLSFTGRMENGESELAWTTAEEKNITWFDVEKSSDGRAFTLAGKVTADAMRHNTYSFRDRWPGEGNNFYRLKIHEQDGNSSYSHILLLHAGTGRAMSCLLYPNPAKALLYIKITGADQEIGVRIYSMTGTNVYDKTLQSANAVIDLAGFIPGMYFVSITYGGATFSSRFIKEQ
jgi:hypothetical protein